MEIQQHAPEQPMRRRTQMENQEILSNENGSTTYQDLWDAAKAVLREV